MAAVSGKLLPRKIAETPRHIANITAVGLPGGLPNLNGIHRRGLTESSGVTAVPEPEPDWLAILMRRRPQRRTATDDPSPRPCQGGGLR
jgi:hypothetical protein